MTTRNSSPTSLRLDLRSRTGLAEGVPASSGVGTTLESEVPVLAGRIEPWRDVSPGQLRAARAGRPGLPHFYWESPDGEVVIGWGAVAWFRAHGESRFADAREWVTRLAAAATLTGAPRGPRPESYLVALGGFAFSPEGAWGEGFEPASFVVPRVLIHRRPDVGTIRIVWGRDDDPIAGEPPIAAPRAGFTPEIPCGALDEGLADQSSWERAVGAALEGIDAGAMEKVVLARRVTANLPLGFDPLDLLDRLRETHPGCYHFLFDFGLGGAFAGASPERLITLRGVRVASDAIAGTAARPSDPRDEADAVERLRGSAKDRSEHEIVVRHIRDALAPFVTELTVGAEPEIQRLRRLLHLRTRLAGKTAKGTHVLELAERLHPTPAVAGSPRAAAIDWIASREPGDRGWYAGPIGWMTAGGDGDFAVGLRGAFLSGRRALLAAGAGIVPGSDPSLEWKETEGKLSVMRDALENA
ncbi:MAG TPA: isochorismate synthase [Candidatus Eisenbacteria bacterium]|nr:isochorismate synthase [Candidatus Eisenbacteria bacterium]